MVFVPSLFLVIFLNLHILINLSKILLFINVFFFVLLANFVRRSMAKDYLFMRTGHWTYVSTKFIKQKESFKTMFVSSKEKEENGQMNLSIHLLGKSTNSQLINLEDL